ncbi:MAG: Gmad2 immunoglobulin-like domain-containing protein, partial [Acidimicrobiales bacterium]
MTPEDRLRSAINHRTTGVEPSPDALQRIEEKLMSAQRATNRNRVLLGIGAVAAAAAVVVGVLAFTGDDEKIDTAGSTSTTAGAPSSSTTEATSTTAPTATIDASVPVFPDATTSRRFDDPVAVTRAFAVELLGFVDPVVGDYQAGDSRSGEVEIRAFSGGNPTTVAVRRLQDDTWFAISASSATIRLDSPTSDAPIQSPTPLTGAAFAFEGHVAVRLYTDGSTVPIAETFVTGGGDQMGSFSGQLKYATPIVVRDGMLVLLEPSAKDGSTVQATVIRVHF